MGAGNMTGWIGLALVYGILKGGREIAKKKALGKSAVLEVLFFYTLLSFVMVVPDAKNAMGLQPVQYLYVALKSFVIFIAWLCGFYALDKMPVSLYGVLDLSRMLFSTLLGVVFIGERLTWTLTAALVMVTAGLMLLRVKHGGSNTMEREKVTAVTLLLALASCFLNSVSGTMDKVLMRSMNSSQLQFWYMLFLTLFYAVFLIARKEKFNWRRTLGNGWIWLMSLVFVIGDRALFLANGIEGSRVTVMTLLKQSGCIVTILGGKLVFGEKDTGWKLMCAGIILAGIVLSVL